MSTSPTVSNLPEGYTLEASAQPPQSASATASQQSQNRMNLPPGYTLEQPTTTQTPHQGLPEGYTLEQPGGNSDSPQLPARQATHYDGSKMGSRVPNSILNGSDTTGDAIGGLTLAGGTAIAAEPIVSAAIEHLGGLAKITEAAKKLGWTTFGLKEAHDLYKMASEALSSEDKK